MSGWGWPSLQACLVGFLLVVFVPTLGVVAIALWNSGTASRDASGRQLLETAHVVAQSVTSELDATARLLAGYVSWRPQEGEGPFHEGSLQSARLRRDGAAPAGDVPAATAQAAASSGQTVVSDIFPAGGDAAPHLAIAMPAAAHDGEVEVVSLVARPDVLIRTLLRRDSFAGSLVAAVTDGTGRIIARSRDPETYIGRLVPDWARLRALGAGQGLFEARTLEGPEVIFAFQTIPGTPGWVAVVGEPLPVFNDRWQQPIVSMIVASAVTMAAALLLAILLSRRILRPIEALARRARMVAAGQGPEPVPVTVPRSFVAEFEALRQSLDDAEAALRSSAEAQRAVAQDLALQRERLELAAEASHLGVWDYNIDDGTAFCDERWHVIFGLDPATPIDSIEAFSRWVHPDDLDRVTRERLAALSARDQIHHSDYRIVNPAGDIRWIASSARLIEGDRDRPTRLVGIVRDVTEEHRAEVELQRSYEALRQAERLARIGSWSLDLTDGRFACSDMLYALNGHDPVAMGPLRLEHLRQLMMPESLRRMTVAMEHCRDYGVPYAVEIEHLRPDGTRFPAEVRGQAIRDDAGRIVGMAGTVQDISERAEERARLAALADNLPSGALYRLEQPLEGPARLAYVSAGILGLIGVPAEAVVADRAAFLGVIDPEDLPGYEEAVQQACAMMAVFDREFRVNTRDGRHIWMHCRSAPRTQSDGRIVWDGIMRDITTEKRVAEALLQAKDSAEAAERTKSDFLATMSHEIRTPMNTVIGMTRLTLQTELAPKQRNYLEKIDASARTLLGIIDDILDFSKIEAGGLALEDTPFTLEAVLEAVSAVTAMRAEEKGLEIAYTVAPDAPRNLRGDPLRLGQVLTNLVSNAVKFTEAGEVVVSIGLASPAEGPGLLQFTVRDTGIGLDAAQVAGLFRPFTQAATDTARKYGGTGLGLAICRQLVGMMGGRIWVDSTPGRGSAFSFTIAAGTAGSEARRPRGARLAGRRALIVDDNASARQILLAMVQDFGMAAEAVGSGAQALDMLLAAEEKAHPFDIVLMDWRMPGMDGLEAARLIRAEQNLPHMPAVLMVTAYGREEVLRGVEQLSLQGLLIKPITESVMFNTVSDILLLPDPDQHARESIVESTRRRGLPLRDALFSSLAGKRVLVVDDNALNREVASDFLRAAGMAVETATDGLDALQALGRQRYDAVLMDIHMPRMNGLAATRAIRAEPRWAALPVIALTAQARSEDLRASLDAGMTAHLSKPIDEMALYRTLAEALGGIDGPAVGQAGAARRAAAPPAAPAGFDMQAVLRRLGGKPDRVARLLDGFLRDFADGARRMSDLLRAGDAEAVAGFAHTVKGSAAYFDAHDLCATAAQIEDAARQGNAAAMRAPGAAFGAELDQLLAAIRAALPAVADGAGQPADPAGILALIAQAAPLVTRGDYAAQSLLERIGAALQGQPGGDLAERACTHFGELELTAAAAALGQLRAMLEVEAGAGVR
ncbi:MAG TPA: response regulator [Roseomonas sp.]